MIPGEGKNASTDPLTAFDRPRNIEIKLENSLYNYKFLYVIFDGLQNDVKKHVLISRALLNAASLVLFKAEYVIAIVIAGMCTNVVHRMN